METGCLAAAVLGGWLPPFADRNISRRARDPSPHAWCLPFTRRGARHRPEDRGAAAAGGARRDTGVVTSRVSPEVFHGRSHCRGSRSLVVVFGAPAAAG